MNIIENLSDKGGKKRKNAIFEDFSVMLKILLVTKIFPYYIIKTSLGNKSLFGNLSLHSQSHENDR